ncbi:unnamed protein product [Tuber aestivum]|uniref:Uncharacterized protein n=1 Tax=Tuber aestivum TaxID=59557 RepID=A0A292PJP5_9PEZI|nr:unnamed protein product [Tuber aestivum]
MGKPPTAARFSWDLTSSCAQQRHGSWGRMNHRGPEVKEILFAPPAHQRNYEIKPRRKTSEAVCNTEPGRKRKRDKRESGENVGRKRGKGARVAGNMLKPVISSRSYSRDRLTLPSIHGTGLFKKGRASHPVKSGRSFRELPEAYIWLTTEPNSIGFEMRFLAETREDQAAPDRPEIPVVSGGEEFLRVSLGSEVSQSDSAQKSSGITHGDEVAHVTEMQGKVKHGLIPTSLAQLNGGRTTTELPQLRCVTQKKVVPGPASDVGDFFGALQTLLSPAHTASKRIMPGRTSSNKPKLIVANASAGRGSQGLKGSVDERLRKHVPGQSQAVSPSLEVGGLQLRGTEKAEGVFFGIRGDVRRPTKSGSDGEYKEQWSSSPLSALLRVCSAAPDEADSRRNMGSLAPHVMESASRAPPVRIKEMLGRDEARDQAGGLRYNGRVYDDNEWGGARGVTCCEKAKYEDREGQIQYRGDGWSVRGSGRQIGSDEGQGGGVGAKSRRGLARVGQATPFNVLSPCDQEWLDNSGSGCLRAEYLGANSPGGLTSAGTIARIEEEVEEMSADKSPGIPCWDWIDNPPEGTEIMQDSPKGPDILETKHVISGVNEGYKEDQYCSYSRRLMEDNGGFQTLPASANPGAHILGRKFWRPNLRA